MKNKNFIKKAIISTTTLFLAFSPLTSIRHSCMDESNNIVINDSNEITLNNLIKEQSFLDNLLKSKDQIEENIGKYINHLLLIKDHVLDIGELLCCRRDSLLDQFIIDKEKKYYSDYFLIEKTLEQFFMLLKQSNEYTDKKAYSLKLKKFLFILLDSIDRINNFYKDFINNKNNDQPIIKIFADFIVSLNKEDWFNDYNNIVINKVDNIDINPCEKLYKNLDEYNNRMNDLCKKYLFKDVSDFNHDNLFFNYIDINKKYFFYKEKNSSIDKYIIGVNSHNEESILDNCNNIKINKNINKEYFEDFFKPSLYYKNITGDKKNIIDTESFYNSVSNIYNKLQKNNMIVYSLLIGDRYDSCWNFSKFLMFSYELECDLFQTIDNIGKVKDNPDKVNKILENSILNKPLVLHFFYYIFQLNTAFESELNASKNTDNDDAFYNTLSLIGLATLNYKIFNEVFNYESLYKQIKEKEKLYSKNVDEDTDFIINCYHYLFNKSGLEQKLSSNNNKSIDENEKIKYILNNSKDLHLEINNDKLIKFIQVFSSSKSLNDATSNILNYKYQNNSNNYYLTDKKTVMNLPLCISYKKEDIVNKKNNEFNTINNDLIDCIIVTSNKDNDKLENNALYKNIINNDLLNLKKSSIPTIIKNENIKLNSINTNLSNTNNKNPLSLTYSPSTDNNNINPNTDKLNQDNKNNSDSNGSTLNINNNISQPNTNNDNKENSNKFTNLSTKNDNKENNSNKKRNITIIVVASVLGFGVLGVVVYILLKRRKKNLLFKD